MTITAQIVPFEQVFGLDGLPLDNGKIYIGVVNQDPQFNPVQVYWDAAGTIPAAQPIRTVAGYISYNGAPSNLYVNGNYSLRVSTKNDQQVYYLPDTLMSSSQTALTPSTGLSLLPTYAALRNYSGSGTVAYVAGRSDDQDGAGATFAVDEADTTSTDNGGTILVDILGRRWKLQSAGSISPRAFGAKGNGHLGASSTDDTAAIQATINYADSFDPPLRIKLDGFFRVDNSLKVDRIVDGATKSTYLIFEGDGKGGGFYAYNGVTLFDTNLPVTTAPLSQRLEFNNVVFKSEFPTNPTYVFAGNKFLRSRFNNCMFHRIKAATTNLYLQSIYFTGCTMYGYLGTFLNSTGGAYDVKFDGCMAEAGGSFINLVCNDAISADPVAGCSVTSSLIQSMSGDYITCDRAQGFVVADCYFEGGGGAFLKFDTARNIGNFTANTAISITGCYFSPSPTNLADPGYYCVRWGRTSAGFATGNHITNGVRVHATIPETVLTTVNEIGRFSGVDCSSFVYAQSGFLQAGSGGENLKTIRGQVSGAGAVVLGTGYAAVRNSAGVYTITVTTPFNGVLTPVASPLDSSGLAVSCFVNPINTTQFNVTFRKASDNLPVDSSFTFIATGKAA